MRFGGRILYSKTASELLADGVILVPNADPWTILGQSKAIVVSPKWKLAPTRREQEKWDRATKAATGGSEVMFRELRRPRGDPEVLAAESREQYLKLKNKLQLLTIGIGGVGLVSAYISYTPEITLSFGAGLMGSLA